MRRGRCRRNLPVFCGKLRSPVGALLSNRSIHKLLWILRISKLEFLLRSVHRSSGKLHSERAEHTGSNPDPYPNSSTHIYSSSHPNSNRHSGADPNFNSSHHANPDPNSNADFLCFYVIECGILVARSNHYSEHQSFQTNWNQQVCVHLPQY